MTSTFRLGLVFAGAILTATVVPSLLRTPVVALTPRPQVSPAVTGGVGAIYRQIAVAGSAGRVGALAPAFAWVTPEGQLTDLEVLRGRTVVINFWATWCVPCREEMPALDRVAMRRPDVSFVAVDLQEDGDAVSAFFDRLGLEHLQPVLDPQGQTTRRYGVHSLPVTFFIDGYGVVRHIEVGGPMSETTIERGIANADAPN